MKRGRRRTEPNCKKKQEEEEEEVVAMPAYPWDEFVCPWYTPAGSFPAETIVDPYETIEKLQELVLDPVRNRAAPRICRMLHDYLRVIGNDGYRVRHLPAVATVLEFLAENVDTVDDYRVHLDRMLDLCALPPLLDKPSDRLLCSELVEQYFTVLGYLLAVLSCKRMFLKVHDVLRSLLLERGEALDAAAIRTEDLRLAMENSRLPVTLAELAEASLPWFYPVLLDIVFLLLSVSSEACGRMLEAGLLNTLLSRMDLPYATQFRCTRPPDYLLAGEEYSMETASLITSILFRLITHEPGSRWTISRCAMWGLRYSFKRQVVNGQHSPSSLKLRNEMTTIILTGLLTVPTWNLVNSGLADDLIFILGCADSGRAFLLSETVKFTGSNEDLSFFKALLLIVVHLAEIDACVHWMVKRKLMRTVLLLVNPAAEGPGMPWSGSQFRNLSGYSLKALSVLAPRLDKEFVKYNGTARLTALIEWSLTEAFCLELASNCASTVCSMVARATPILLEDLRSHGTVLPLIKTIDRILALERITMQHQRAVTLLLTACRILMKGQPFLQQVYAEQSIRIFGNLSHRFLYQDKTIFQVDQRVLIAMGSFVWDCIVESPTSLEKFVEAAGVYVILDTIEVSSFRTRCVFLGLLVDICDGHFCGPYLCTWRGLDRETGLASLLARIWREEELRIGARRWPDGSIEDVELPQMGQKQFQETFRDRPSANASPAINEMLGSVRPKIYGLRRIIDRDKDRYEAARNRYKILLNGLSLEDQITTSSMDLYFRLKLGEVWTEVSRYLDHVGITPLGMDGQVMSLMIQRHLSWAMLAKERQRKLVLSARELEEREEKDEYARIRNSKLAPALDAFDELEYIRRTADRAYALQKRARQKLVPGKEKQRVENAL